MHASGIRFRVDNTQKKLGTLFVHEGLVEAGELRVGLPLSLPSITSAAGGARQSFGDPPSP